MQTLPVERLPGSWVGTLVVSGLGYGQHSVKIESAPDFVFSGGRNDFTCMGLLQFCPFPFRLPFGCGLLDVVCLVTGMRKRSEG
ncbi:hypothetical protein SAMN05216403_102163 [Nitrosospira multiformis ATCC 25196]|uniref:Uncharacterized protein n=1 Tax=Nitrosospira multiformis (strain ATCC 25196 / NCIMB 11849 / C 71) TaxID=323848 RepID=A0A1H5SGP9_NITMU|nr:hypothetical protein SAMN05216403_102163 [Nitrosospira multiformis ATCC 25196]